MKADVNSIDYDYIDINNDKKSDLILKLHDETGYTPLILLRLDNNLFKLGFDINKHPLYINTEIIIDDDGNVKKPKEHTQQITDNTPTLIFYKVHIRDKYYKHIEIRYDNKTNTFLMVK